ncbi:MAG: preprotein translocase subunit SecG [Alphaproteobacteria bacterium]|nr:preprotein translocase subunit SecG [Alphaproteobacteria bacterium]
MQTVLLVFELLVAVALIIAVLLQRSEGGALGMGGGGSGLGGLFSPRGASDTLTRTTAILAVLFFGICLGLNLLVARTHQPRSILDSPGPATHTLQPVQKPLAPPPSQPKPSVPTPH